MSATTERNTTGRRRNLTPLERAVAKDLITKRGADIHLVAAAFNVARVTIVRLVEGESRRNGVAA